MTRVDDPHTVAHWSRELFICTPVRGCSRDMERPGSGGEAVAICERTMTC